MDIKYAWSPSGATPNEVCDITYTLGQGQPVPRKGELVELDVALPGDVFVTKSGRVSDVIWTVSGFPKVTILLGQ